MAAGKQKIYADQTVGCIFFLWLERQARKDLNAVNNRCL